MNRAVGLFLKLCFSLAFSAVLLVGIEIGAFFLRRAVAHLPQHPDFDMSASSVYQGQAWAAQFWKDAGIAFADDAEKYWPFVVWKLRPHNGETIAIGANGLRRTLPSHCDDSHAYTIWMFGGSTMLGQGVPDWFTVPSQLASLYEKSGRPACVVNYGQLGWVNTQETIELTLELKKQARKPDLVLFYDGINDTGITLGPDEDDTHLNFQLIRRKFENDDQRRPGSLRYLLESNTARLLIGFGERMAARRASRQPYAKAVDEARWKDRLRVAYLSNQDLVNLLAEKYRFAYVFFWQPIIYTRQKPLTPEEQSIVERSKAHYDPGGGISQIYDFMRGQSRPHFFDIADTFSGVHETLYIDPWHLGPKGNSLIAARMFEILMQHGQ
jgi:lysophospholipase L1-like esterase